MREVGRAIASPELLGLGRVEFRSQLAGRPCAGSGHHCRGLGIETHQIKGQGNVGFGLSRFEEFHGRMAQSMAGEGPLWNRGGESTMGRKLPQSLYLRVRNTAHTLCVRANTVRQDADERCVRVNKA